MRDDYLYSAVALGNGALGTLNLFMNPEGADVPFAGDLHVEREEHQRRLTKLTTNIGRARADFNPYPSGLYVLGAQTTTEGPEDEVPDAQLRFRKNGETFFVSSFENLRKPFFSSWELSAWKPLPRTFFGRMDAFQVDLVLSEPLKRKDIKAFLAWVHIRVESKHE